MPVNASVLRFIRLTTDLKTEVRVIALTTVAEQAAQLADLMRSVVPVDQGTLRNSIRVEPGKYRGQVLVKAGGAATTKAGTRSGQPPYDYAMAQEFGTHEDHAQPFFWPSYRLRRNNIRATIRRRTTTAIKRRSAE